jgi:hypothetical protein
MINRVAYKTNLFSSRKLNNEVQSGFLERNIDRIEYKIPFRHPRAQPLHQFPIASDTLLIPQQIIQVENDVASNRPSSFSVVHIHIRILGR